MSNKLNLKPRAMMYPSPAVIASAYDEEGKADSCTLAFAAMCSHQPPAVMIAINSTAKRKTLRSILERKEFVLGFPTIDQVAETDYIGMASGYEVDKVSKPFFALTRSSGVISCLVPVAFANPIHICAASSKSDNSLEESLKICSIAASLLLPCMRSKR